MLWQDLQRTRENEAAAFKTRHLAYRQVIEEGGASSEREPSDAHTREPEYAASSAMATVRSRETAHQEVGAETLAGA